MYHPIYLGVNIDHVATLRNARGTHYPEPVHAALIAEQAGADGITIHLREDRRHIVDRDVPLINSAINTRLNFEMAVTEEMLCIAEQVKPVYVCMVPEKREEVTTEGGLDVIANEQIIKQACERMEKAGILVSLFIDASMEQIDAVKRCGAPVIELHTGAYADATSEKEQLQELKRIEKAARYAHELGIQVNAGHGLHYHNVQPIARIPEIVELNIGHAIVARALFTGFEAAVREMKRLMVEARSWQS